MSSEKGHSLVEFLTDALAFGCLKGFKYFETYLRGREELLVRVYKDRKTPRERGSYTATYAFTNRHHTKLFLSPKVQESLKYDLDTPVYPPASPCDRELENDDLKEIFLIAGYARYKSPFVWIRSRPDKNSKFQIKNQDTPLPMETIKNWKTSDIRVWDIVSEIVFMTQSPPPSNPFAIDHSFYNNLSVEESIVCSGAMINFLSEIYKREYPFADQVMEDIILLTDRHFDEYLELLDLGKE